MSDEQSEHEKYIGMYLYNKKNKRIGKVVAIKTAFNKLCLVVNSVEKYWSVTRINNKKEGIIYLRES